MTSSIEFVADVGEKTHLNETEAHELIENFLTTLGEFVDREAWQLIVGLTPIEVSVDWEDLPRREDDSTEAFLLEMSRVEGVEDPRAAEHARAVAQTIRSRARAAEIDRLRTVVRNEDLLALFEEVRGEFTTAETAANDDQSLT